jgi:hypothetical protein
MFCRPAFRYISVIKTNLMHYLSLVYTYFINQPLHDSGVIVAHHQEVYCIQGVPGEICQTLEECSLC